MSKSPSKNGEKVWIFFSHFKPPPQTALRKQLGGETRAGYRGRVLRKAYCFDDLRNTVFGAGEGGEVKNRASFSGENRL